MFHWTFIITQFTQTVFNIGNTFACTLNAKPGKLCSTIRKTNIGQEFLGSIIFHQIRFIKQLHIPKFYPLNKKQTSIPTHTYELGQIIWLTTDTAHSSARIPTLRAVHHRVTTVGLLGRSILRILRSRAIIINLQVITVSWLRMCSNVCYVV